MKRLRTLVILCIVAIVGITAFESTVAQDKPDNTKNSAKTAADRKKLDWWRKRKASRARDSALKAHMKHQTRKVRRRMKKDAKKAKITNGGGDY